MAEQVLSQLKLTPPTGRDTAGIRVTVIEKNRLFNDCWRPANRSFVYGDRVSQLFGQAGGSEPSLRETYEMHKPMIAA